MATILFVDDEVFVTTMLHTMITQSIGCEVAVKNSVDEAKKYLEVNPVDLIVLDINMRGETSLLFMEEISHHPHWHSIPVVMLSALYTDEVKAAFEKRGATLFFKKEDIVTPLGKKQFIEKLQSLLG